jgi:cytochrome c-type biogenesis protein CcmH
MIAFAVTAFSLLITALLIVLWPLLRRSSSPVLTPERSNLDIHRIQLAELKKDLDAGSLGPERYQQALHELERRVLEEGGGASAIAPRPIASGKTVPLIVGLFIPSAAILLYLYLGNLQGIGAPRHPAADMSSITADQFQDMTAKLAARMQQNPNDAEGWKMLGRAYRAMERYAEANEAFKKAVALSPQNADLLADYAESLALQAGRSLAGEPTQLLNRALKLEPDNAKVLTLSGSAAFERGDYKTAIKRWEAVLTQPNLGGELAQALQKGVEESKQRMSGKAVAAKTAGKERVTGEVRLDNTLNGKVQPDDTVFVFARAASGPRMPLAIAKIKVADLPYKFSFDDSSAMTPEMKLSRFSEIVIGARVSKTGSATPAAGDLEGTSGKVKSGSGGIRVLIDHPVAGS